MNPSSCYEDTKKKGGHNKLKGGQPLIKDKRQLRDVSKEKSIEKPLKTTHEYHSTKPNVDYHKQRVLQDLPPHEPDPVRTFTAQLSHLNVLHFGQPLHVPPSANPDKLATSGVLHFQQTNRNLTFGNVRQVKNPKEIGHT